MAYNKVCRIYRNLCWINKEQTKRSQESLDKSRADIKANGMVK